MSLTGYKGFKMSLLNKVYCKRFAHYYNLKLDVCKVSKTVTISNNDFVDVFNNFDELRDFFDKQRNLITLGKIPKWSKYCENEFKSIFK